MTFFHCSMLCCVLICWIRFKARPPPKPGAWFSTFFVLRFLCFQQTHYLTWEVEIKYTVLFDGYVCVRLWLAAAGFLCGQFALKQQRNKWYEFLSGTVPAVGFLTATAMKPVGCAGFGEGVLLSGPHNCCRPGSGCSQTIGDRPVCDGNGGR